MLIEKIPTSEGILYAVDLTNKELRHYLEKLQVKLNEVVGKEIQKQILLLEEQRLQEILNKYGYTSLADVMYYAQVQSDEEAKALLNWYSNSEGNGYDDLIWDWIDNELPKYQTIEELLSIDLKQIETQIFEKTKDLLPKEED